MKTGLILVVFLFQSLSAFACLFAKQHKLFPVGINNDNIVFIETHIYRAEDISKNDKERNTLKIKWEIKTYISIYNKSQDLISKTEIDDSEIKGDSYVQLLKTSYAKGLFQIESLYPNLDHFTAEYLSFCDYQKKCKRLEIQHDSLNKKDTFKYKKQDFNVKLPSNKNDEESDTFTGDLSAYFLNSIRVYKTKDLELVIGHLATGHEVSMGWITDNPKNKSNESGDPIHEAKPYDPDFEFKELHVPVYQEPIMHHGYGFDLFIVKD